MTTTLRTRVAALALASAAPALILGSLSSASAATAVPTGASTATVVPNNDVGHYGLPFKGADGKPAAADSFDVVIDGATHVNAYCVNFAKTLNRNAPLHTGPRSALGLNLANVGKAASIARDGKHIGAKMADQRDEAEAEQLAVWHFTNNLDYHKANYTPIENRTAYLIAHAGTVAETPSSFVLTAVPVVQDKNVVVTVKAATGAGAALANQVVTYSTPTETKTVTTDATGTATFTVAEAKDVYTGTLSSVFTMAAGTVLLGGTATEQPLITETPTTVTRNATFAVPALPPVQAATPPTAPPAPPVVVVKPPVVKPAPPVKHPVAQPATPVAKPAGRLPFTGTSVTTTMFLAAAALLGLGIFAKLRLRK